MKYNVTLVQTIYGEVVVEANSEEEAKEAAFEAYNFDECVWDETSNVDVVEITRL